MGYFKTSIEAGKTIEVTKSFTKRVGVKVRGGKAKPTAEEIEKVMTDTLIKFKARLMAIPAKQSPILSKKKDQTEIFKLLKAAIDEALEELADFQKLFGYTIEDEEKNS